MKYNNKIALRVGWEDLLLKSGGDLYEGEVFFLEALTSWGPKGLFRPVRGLLYLTVLCISNPILKATMIFRVSLPTAVI
jgi:hypothetical protein